MSTANQINNALDWREGRGKRLHNLPPREKGRGVGKRTGLSFIGVSHKVMSVSVKNITNVTTKHGFVATVFETRPILADFSSSGEATAMKVSVCFTPRLPPCGQAVLRAKMSPPRQSRENGNPAKPFGSALFLNKAGLNAQRRISSMASITMLEPTAIIRMSPAT